MKQSERREHLIDTAITLFSKNGFHATGVDTIIAAAGISKKTLYRHFRSKDELILAALRKYSGQFRNGFMRDVEWRATAPRERILAIFDVAHDWFEDKSFYGCMYINAIGEFSAPNTPIRIVCKEFKTLMRSYMEQLIRDMGIDNAEPLSEELALLLEGAIVTAQVSENKGHAATVAKSAAQALIEKAEKGHSQIMPSEA
ncbi:MAG: TetR/AcrR family transcriptional regulator [Rhodospirillales bacterium]